MEEEEKQLRRATTAQAQGKTPQYHQEDEKEAAQRAFLARLSLASQNPEYWRWTRLVRRAQREETQKKGSPLSGPHPLRWEQSSTAPVDWHNDLRLTGTHHLRGFTMDRRASRRLVTREMIEKARDVTKKPSFVIPDPSFRPSSREKHIRAEARELLATSRF